MLVGATACGGTNESKTAAGPPTTAAGRVTTLPPPVTATVAPTTTTLRQAVEVTNVGLSTGTQFSRKVVSAAAVIRNPSSQVAGDIRVNINLKDANGSIVQSETASIAVLAPGEEAYAAPAFYLDQGSAVPVAAEAQAQAGEFFSQTIGSFTFKDMKYNQDQYSARVTGTITSGITKTVTQVMVYCATFFGDNVTGGGFTFVDLVPAGQSTGFNVGNGIIPGMRVNEVRCSGSPSNLSRFS